MSENFSLQTELWTYGTTLRKRSLVQKISILEEHWANQPMKYDLESEYEFITRNESSKIENEEEQNILVQQCQRSEDQ